MTDGRKKVLKQIDANRDKSIKFLQQMIAIPSVTGDEGKIQEFLVKLSQEVDLDVDMWESDWEELKKHPGYIPVDRVMRAARTSSPPGKAPAADEACCSTATPT